MPRVVQVNLAVAGAEAAINDAARRLKSGGVVAFPTETVYGLGADTFNAGAIDVVYELKGRPSDNPLIAHVLDTAQAQRVVRGWDERCARLTARFWPGPLTLVVPRSFAVPPEATAGLDTIAVRCPSHPVARRLLAAFGGPISAPSANRSGHVSPTCAEHVVADFNDAADLLILDGGPCEVGIESTVLDVMRIPAVVLRPGAVTPEMIRAEIGEVEVPDIGGQAASPGTSPAHYAPLAAARLVATDDLDAALGGIAGRAMVLCFDAARVAPPHGAIAMPRDAEAYAKRLYAALREADAALPAVILIERPPPSGVAGNGGKGPWGAVLDRLRRATSRGGD